MIIFIIIIIFIFISLLKYKRIEKFSLSIFDRKKPYTFNNNYDKSWLRPYVSLNSANVQDIPNKEYLDHSKFNIIKNIEYTKSLNNLFSEYVIKNKDKKILYYTENSNSKDDLTIKTNKLNKKSWKNKYMNLDLDIRVDYKFIPCSFTVVNDILNKVFEIIKYRFVIYKYKISTISKFENGNYSFGLIIVLLQKFGYFGYTFFISGYKKNKEIILSDYEFIGHYYTENFFLLDGLNKYDSYFNINNKLKISTPYKYKNNKKIINFDEYKCFTADKNVYTNPSIKDNIILPYYSKEDCESSVNIYGKNKKIGIWDKPCKKDSDCFFYEKNKNYSNSFGGCNNGYCEMPIDVQRIGFRYYLNDNKPFCYNCNTKSWKAITNLDTCCDDQHDKKKYPFLKSPDYAYKNDLLNRLNYFNQNNY